MGAVMGKIDQWRSLAENDQLFDYIIKQLEGLERFGPIPGILFPLIEALLPILPLVAFVLANAVVYGLFKGFLYSWIGAVIGSLGVFFIIRRLGDKRLFRKITRQKQVKRVTRWVEEHGFGPLFLLICFPFSPSSIINIVAGLSRVSRQQFILAVLLGKAVMIFTIAYVGSSIASFAQNPVKSIVVGICILLFWVIGKFIEKRVQIKVEQKARSRD
ncbi:TVP38/TMEM64 family protein [Halobacillus karajensis]|uniref:TVP38/TMEM64 family membrane protein n=1 Tax=Halobacillus karajensis TaxID=195088 RepID=A0A024P8W3_9BACI|nr:TVP38/TMEM64 family protein [Halobacillus karajensis]CDQ21079.1 TVP38/TMEM64 family inner membrane protein YdjZ [Halobacillus karajensis]CDQ24857.1 TVP38/TMEM64 family inner membrane protein YdjZ [Halobacillus karajensis]CDQ28783.1 TVP38/TMEM64 family inner membrane protein YdjZ [Halobacillus karajensis]